MGSSSTSPGSHSGPYGAAVMIVGCMFSGNSESSVKYIAFLLTWWVEGMTAAIRDGRRDVALPGENRVDGREQIGGDRSGEDQPVRSGGEHSRSDRGLVVDAEQEHLGLGCAC